ncbi:protein CHLOROPLAST IMPORT APPARATUS 2 isoform X2 [Benincasa hispida]|uniref:protein CHLOROPLAST IMPORT APPARATUS 2 isoform X2 n=1 Tax=Benincasa hispida TaxID=102211 RepID=UPI001900203A|nr:protein CHLOROPLAST IMPORT APPARATUS 2 isoform X2 [Benincasa hispida]
MSSPCISGGGRAYNFDLEIVKSPSSSWTRTSQTSSPSSTLSESSNNTQLAISTRKSRTPRKRPNQTYNEATVLLSTAYPNVFSTKHLTNPRKFTKSHDSLFCESAELLLPFRVIDSSGFLLHQPPLVHERPNSQIHSKLTNLWENRPCSSPGEIDFQPNSMEIEEIEDFDAESILDEEIEEGIDSIMGNLSVDNLETGNSTQDSCVNVNNHPRNWNCYWSPIGLGFNQKFESGFGMRKGIERTAIRGVDNGNWWRFPTVDVVEISPKLNPKPPVPAPAPSAVATKKKKKKVEKLTVIESKKAAMPLQKEKLEKSEKSEKPIPKLKPTGLLLKLNYEAVADAWSSRGSPFSDEIPGSDTAGSDVNARLAQIDLFSDGGGLLREASVLRYKEKRRTRLFSKKIRYQVRKVNADGRPRMKGRFVRRPNSSASEKRETE